MIRRKGFTLIELLVVVAIIALLISILVPSLTRVREIAKRTVCKTHCGSIGKALAIYIHESQDQYPFLPNTSSTAWEDTPTGENREKDPVLVNGIAQNARSNSSLLFLLIRKGGQDPGLFICPSVSQETKEENAKATSTDGDVSSGEYYWDFTDDTHISYSFQAPLVEPSDTTLSYSGITQSSPGSLPILADQTPTTMNSNWDIPDWSSDSLSAEDKVGGMSRNHTIGETESRINVLRMDTSVVEEDAANVGIKKDNVYTAYDGTGGNDDQQQGELDITLHKDQDDSYLIGPVVD